MKPKTIKIIYWTITIFLSLFMLFSAIGGMMQKSTDNPGMKNLGYPLYFFTILGVGKILGVIALLQPRFKSIKEWAYAGFSIDFISAFWSMIVVGEVIPHLIAPIIALALLFSSYFLWKKLIQIKPA